MKEAVKQKGASFMKNVLILMFAQVSVKLLGLIYRLVITNAEGFGNTGLGYYSTGYQIYSLLLALSSIGIPSVVSKMVSERIAIGDNKGAQRIFKISMTFFVSLGLAFSLLLFFAAEPIATLVFNVPDVKYVMQVLAPAIVFVAASAVFRGYFAWQNDMKPTSASQILEQFFNCVLSITFVYALIGKEPYIMAAGGNLSSTLAIIITFMYLILYYKRRKIRVSKKQISPEKNKTNGQLLKAILAMSIPITISSVISVVNPIIDSSTVSRCIQTAFAGIITGGKEALEEYAMNMTGILAKMDTLVGLPVAINVAFSTALTPAIAAAIAKKDYKIIFLAGGHTHCERMLTELHERNLKAVYLENIDNHELEKGIIYITRGSLSHGFEYIRDKFAVVSEKDAFSDDKKNKRRNSRSDYSNYTYCWVSRRNKRRIRGTI